MADVFTPEKRSEVMSRIRGGNTKPELIVRSLLHRNGYRFTVNGPLNRFLPGRPDLVLPKYRKATQGAKSSPHRGAATIYA
jgi:DNA mismatch endonuclease (patch repair protein)